MPGTAFSHPMADFESLVEHLGASAVESGIGVEPVDFRPGYFKALLPLSELTRTPDGQVSPFALSVFADMGIGVAVNSTVPDSPGGPTVEFTVAMAGDPAPAARFLSVESEAVTVSASSGIGKALICDDTGAPVAHVLGVMATGAERAVPHEKPAMTRFDPRTVTVEALTEGAERARATLDDSMLNSRGMVHGGVLTGIALTAQEAFRGAAARQGLTVAAHFLRPVAPESGRLECRSEFVRQGRTFRTVRTRLLRPDGAVVMEATGTSVIPTGAETS